MKILVFTEGTLTMHKNAEGHTREEIVKQVEESNSSVHDFASYLPNGNAVEKLQTWKNQGAEILYMTSRTKPKEIEDVKNVLKKFRFPDGQLFFCSKNEEYQNVVEKIRPDILIEDDCESIGGETEMITPNLNSKLKIKSIIVKEFGGIDHLPDKIFTLLK